MTRRLTTLTISAAIALILSGCGTVYKTRVSALSAEPHKTPITYVIYPRDKSVHREDLEFVEFASVVERGLAKLGYERVSDPEQANSVIFISVGMSRPQVDTPGQTVPIYGYFGGSVNAGSGARNTEFNQVNSSQTVTRFYHYLRIEALDLAPYRESGQYKPIWRTTATTTDPTDDMRKVLPYLVEACTRYIGKTTPSQVVVNLPDNDPGVEALRPPLPGGLAARTN
ncbi:MAG: DUF4136 domain-containing protein [Phycisphaera sp.]|nr:DUF4136 domain-containing protein [Phycisphaera sp.]